MRGGGLRLLAAVFAGWPALGAPALDLPYPLFQPDGSTFFARTWGDERASGTETLDGFAILRDASETWVYAELDASGALVPSAEVVGHDDPSVPRRLRPVPPIPWLAPGPAPTPGSAPPRPGAHRMLILLTDFTPTQSQGTTAADWHAHAFTGGTSTAPQSVADYWSEVSYGTIQFGPAAEAEGTANDGVVEVTLSYAHPDTFGGDENRQLTADAIVAADPFVNYAAFDDDGDGYLSSDELHLLVVARGYEGAYGGIGGMCSGAGAVWGHHWSLYGAVPAPVVDGIVVASTFGAPLPGPRQGGYEQIGEFHCAAWDPPGHQATIGITAHELGHGLGTGVPDLYDTDDSSNGIGRWALQAAGSWNTTGVHSGMTPAWPDAWSRSFLGIVVPDLAGCVTGRQLPRIETAGRGPDHGVVQLGSNPGGVDWEWGGFGSGEYFLLENRQLVGFDAGLPGSGLLIWHIAENVFGDNSANSSEGSCPPGNPRLVVLEQADGDFELECFVGCGGGGCNQGDSGDTYRAPAATMFDGSSVPSSDLYSGTATGLSVTNVSASGTTMTADLVGPCDDGDPCTRDDGCAAGGCAGTPYVCDDGDACTTDTCNGDGTCTFTPGGVVCDDGEPCTIDACDGTGSCTHTPNSGACDDGDACTTGDSCATGACRGTAFTCDDGNPCTQDTCDARGGCVFSPNSSPCDDASACTHSDRCLAGACRGTRYSCDDDNDCTLDLCLGNGSCTHAPRSGSCNDGFACSFGDSCAGGVCRGITYACRDDGDPCTDEVCIGDGTCVPVDSVAACDDGDACTVDDVCGFGACAGVPLDCDDGDACTTDVCAGGGTCTFTANTALCDDGDPCTTGDRCSEGECSGEPLDCDDGDACTADFCDSGGGCSHSRDFDCQGEGPTGGGEGSGYQSTRGCGCAIASAPATGGWSWLAIGVFAAAIRLRCARRRR